MPTASRARHAGRRPAAAVADGITPTTHPRQAEGGPAAGRTIPLRRRVIGAGRANDTVAQHPPRAGHDAAASDACAGRVVTRATDRERIVGQGRAGHSARRARPPREGSLVACSAVSQAPLRPLRDGRRAEAHVACGHARWSRRRDLDPPPSHDGSGRGRRGGDKEAMRAGAPVARRVVATEATHGRVVEDRAPADPPTPLPLR